MVIDLKRCIGCGACTAACLAENLNSTIYFKKPPLERLVKLADEADTREEREKILKEYLWTRTRVVRLYSRNGIFFLHIMCHHCDNAPCVTVCPTGASIQRRDGIVVVDPEKCILCGYCITACPYGARHFNCAKPYVPVTELNPNMHILGNVPRQIHVVEKCTWCIQRTRDGGVPACVEVCPVKCIKMIREKINEPYKGQLKSERVYVCRMKCFTSST
jgi:Fe-S-cluster-containing dehydrogenase component